MKLYYYKHTNGIKNFGDDLNPWLWNKLMPDIFDENSEVLFSGVGTLLNEKIPVAKKIIVFGSGVGYEKRELPIVNNNWKIYCVRGPLSAKKLGVSLDLSITDPAILTKLFFKKNNEKKYKYSYMPHVFQAYQGRNSWKFVCRELGFGYIDPAEPIEKVFSMIASTEYLVTEALHGAIIADAFGIPWVPIQSNEMILAFKWNDWCASIGFDYLPSTILPLWDINKKGDILKPIRHWLKLKIVIAQLTKIVKTRSPIISKRLNIKLFIDKFQEKIELFKSDIQKGNYSE